MTMTCRELVEFLMAYLDQELPEEQRAEFERHLHACPPCVVYLETYEEAVRLGKDVHREPDALPEAPEELVQAILRTRRNGDA
jgi:anti-sigma factor RsiW